MAIYHILGTYKIDITREGFASAAKHYGWADDWLTETGGLKEDAWLLYLDERAEEKDTIALIEANITGEYSENELLRLTHGPVGSSTIPRILFRRNWNRKNRL
jgi:hypothetical protein